MFLRTGHKDYHPFHQKEYICIVKEAIFPSDSDGKEFACSAGVVGSILRWERSSGEGNGYPLRYSCLENPRGRGAWRARIR